MFPLQVDNTCVVRPVENYPDWLIAELAGSTLSDAAIDWFDADDDMHQKHNDVIVNEC